MAFYIFLILFSALLSCVYSIKSMSNRHNQLQKKSILWFVCSGLIVFLSMALRYGIGTDYFFTYVPRFYQYMSDPKGAASWEPAFKWLYLFLVKCTNNPQWVFVITGAVIVGCIWYSIYKLSPMPWFSVLLFFISRQYFISLNIVRQFTGLALVCIGFVFLKDRKYWGYIICCVLGTMCHYSVAIFLPLLLLAFVKINPAESIVLIGVLSVLNPFIKNFARLVVAYTPYSKYIDTEYDLTARYQSWTIFEMIFVFSLVSLLIEQKPIKENEHIIQFLYNIETICLLFSFNLNIVPNSDRISWSLELPSIFLVPLVVSRCDSKRDKILIVAAVCLVYSYVMYNRIFILNDHETVPYQLIPSISLLFVGK
ncbi:MAG: EpsG family protein [Oscillospiraceae bacterium]|nr:EpsG family protein [Oscillospiraceae bacterium]